MTEAARRPDWALLGTLGWWGFNVAILWASFKAFGEAPPLAVCAQAYFVGLLANLLPLPGGIGGVDAGMVGALLAFNVDPGRFTYRLVRGELEFDDYGQVFAHCRVDRGPWTVVPFTLLAPD